MNNSIAETLEKHWFVVTKNKDPTLERQNSSQEVKKQPSSRQHFSVSVHRTEIFNYATVDLSCKVRFIPLSSPAHLLQTRGSPMELWFLQDL